MTAPLLIVELRELAHRDAMSARNCRESAEEWRANLPSSWLAVLPSRELDALCSYVWGEDWLEKRAQRWATRGPYG